MSFLSNVFWGKTNWKALLVLVILAVIVGGGSLWYSKQVIQVHKISQTQQQKKDEETEQSGKFLYYYSQSYDPALFSIYRFNFDIAENDNLVAKFNGDFSIIGKSLGEGKFFVCRSETWPCDNKLYILDVKTGELKEYLAAEEGKSFRSAVFSHNKNFLAYTLLKINTNAELGEVKETGEVWIYDLEEKNHRKIFEQELGWTSLFVEGWNKKDNKLIVRELGGEGGQSWGAIYLVEATKTVDNYTEIPLLGDDFLFGTLSPDGENWLYHYCEKPTWEYPESESCEEGAEIEMYNFEESNSTTIYKNTFHPDNIYRRKLRVINSVVWQDSENIIFSIPQGIYKIDLDSKQPEELYAFNWSDPDAIFRLPPWVEYANDDIVIYHRGENFILNLSTKKNMGLGKNMSDINWFLE
jgi:hypothetical protein